MKAIEALPIVPNPVQEKQPEWEMGAKDWAAVLGAALGAFMAILDIQITNASLREIQGSLGLDFSEGGWISTSYLIAEIVVIPLTGFFSRIFGMRTYILVNGFLFILASALCGCAWNLQSMICFRVFQGLTGGTLIPMSFQTMLLFMPAEKKPIGLALFGLTATLAPTLGPSIGGLLTETYGWRTNFFINIVPGALMLLVVRYGMPVARMKLSKLKEIDLWGILTLSAGLAALTYLLEEGAKVQWFSDDSIRLCAFVAMSALPTFVVLQLVRKNPLLNLRLLTNRNFAIAGVITMMTAVALYGGIYALSLYLSQIQNYGAVRIGQVMMWVGIPQILVMPLLPFLMKHVDLRLLAVIGMLLFAISNFLNANLSMNYAGEQFRISLIIRAIGQPLFLIPLSAMAISLVSPAEAGNASSIYNVMRNIGGSMGIALTETFAVSRYNFHFYRNLEHLSAFDFRTTERLTGIQWYLASRGLDLASAKAVATKLLISLTQRESLILCFSDIFLILAYGLVACTVLICFFKKHEGEESAFEMH